MDEYERFALALRTSDLAVHLVANYIRETKNIKECHIILLPIRKRHEPMKVHGESHDIWALKTDNTTRTFEVKGVAKSFTCEQDYPFDTVYLDRVNKELESDYTVIVNQALTHGYFFSLDTKPHWKIVETMDQKKGYPWTGYECPKQYGKVHRLRGAK